MSDNWIDQFPALAALEPAVVERLVASSKVLSLPAGTKAFGPGSAPANYLLVLEGSIRVQQMSESGREIVLYRVGTGQSCALTTACLMAYDDYQAEAIAEEPVRAVAIPRQVFDELLSQSETFRRFVFTAFSKRITDLFRIIEEVAFERIDIRLAQRLIELAGESDHLVITHQRLAAELGSAREVISRQLGEFQRRGWVASARGSIRLIDKPAIGALAATHRE